MERESYYFLFLLIGLAICAGVFWFQFNYETPTYLIFNATEVEENGSFAGVLNDAYGFPVANKTITYHNQALLQQCLYNNQRILFHLTWIAIWYKPYWIQQESHGP